MRAPKSKVMRQGGFSLIGAILILSIGGMFMTWMANRSMEQMRISQGEIIGKEMARLNNAVLDFSRRYHYEIKEAIANKAALKLPQDVKITFSRHVIGTESQELWIGNEMVRVTIDDEEKDVSNIEQMLRSVKMDSVNGRPPMQKMTYEIGFNVGDATRPDKQCQPDKLSACYIDSVVFIREPITITRNRPDYLKLNAALRQMGPGGGFSVEGDRKNIRFSPTWSKPQVALENPAPRKPVGILLIHNARAVEHFPYARLDGKSPMQGNLKMEGNQITMATRSERSGATSDATIRHQEGKLRIGTPNQEEMRITTAPSSSGGYVDIDGGKLSAKDVVANRELRSKGDVIAQGKLQSEQELRFSRNAKEDADCEGYAVAVDVRGSLMHCKEPSPGERRKWQTVSSGKPPPGSYLQISTADITRSLSGIGTTWRQHILFKAKGQRHPYSETHELAVAGEDWRCYLMQDNERHDNVLTINFERVPPRDRWVAILSTVSPANTGRHDFLLEIGCSVKGHRNARSIFSEYEQRKRL